MKTGDSFNLNLLPSQAKFQAARMKLQAVFRRYMGIAVIIWVLVIVVTIVLHIVTGISLDLENKKYQQAFNGFKSLTDEIVTSQLVKYRIKVLGEVLKNRFEYSTSFEKITSIFSEKASVSRFEIDLNKQFNIVVNANGKEAMNFIEDKVVEANNGGIEGVKKIVIGSAKYSNNGDWLINMGVILQ